MRRDTGAGLRADYVVKSDGFAGFSTDVARRLRHAARARQQAVPIRFTDGAVDGNVETVGRPRPRRARPTSSTSDS